LAQNLLSRFLKLALLHPQAEAARDPGSLCLWVEESKRDSPKKPSESNGETAYLPSKYNHTILLAIRLLPDKRSYPKR